MSPYLLEMPNITSKISPFSIADLKINIFCYKYKGYSNLTIKLFYGASKPVSENMTIYFFHPRPQKIHKIPSPQNI